MGELEKLIRQFPESVPAAIDTAIKGRSVIDRYLSPMCFLRSCLPEDDVMIDMLAKLDREKRIKYYVASTMEEFNLNFEHLKYLEKKYDIEIDAAVVVVSQDRTIQSFAEVYRADLVITSERQFEHGVQSKHDTCMTKDRDFIDSYRPLFWFTDEDLKAYDDACGIIHSEVRS